MRPIIVQPPDVSGAALAELKAWLGIRRPNEDALLESLLQASLSACEDAISLTPLVKIVEERLPNKAGSHCLTSRPIKNLSQIEAIGVDGARELIDGQAASLEFDEAGWAQLDIGEQSEASSVAVQVSVGISDIWEDLPPSLKQAIIRLSAFYFRERDQDRAEKMPIPSSVEALLRPWRELRLS
ncbi:MAG: hypothetical protein AAGL10_16210 [Pseudomonadota bacterium]